MGIDGILFQVHLDCHYYCQPSLICMSILHQRIRCRRITYIGSSKSAGICGMHVLYISLILRTMGNFIFLPVQVCHVRNEYIVYACVHLSVCLWVAAYLPASLGGSYVFQNATDLTFSQLVLIKLDKFRDHKSHQIATSWVVAKTTLSPFSNK